MNILVGTGAGAVCALRFALFFLCDWLDGPGIALEVADSISRQRAVDNVYAHGKSSLYMAPVQSMPFCAVLYSFWLIRRIKLAKRKGSHLRFICLPQLQSPTVSERRSNTATVGISGTFEFKRITSSVSLVFCDSSSLCVARSHSSPFLHVFLLHNIY